MRMICGDQLEITYQLVLLLILFLPGVCESLEEKVMTKQDFAPSFILILW